MSRWLRAGLPVPERVADVAVEGARGEDLFWNRAWLPGEPFYVYGRMPETRTVKLSLTLGRGKQTVVRDWTFPVERREDDVFVGRLWAQRRLDQIRRMGDSQPEDVRKRTVALSQEWSLLSPHTAFLVLESEQDYPRWGLDRRVRRRYWKPAEARPEAPLPADWVQQFRQQEQAERSDEELAEALREAREALAAKDFARAHRRLGAVANLPPAAQSEEFRSLRQQALEGFRAQSVAKSSTARRGLLDPAAPDGRADLQPSVTTLLGSAFRADPDFVRRHPHAERLLQEVDMATLARGQTLEEFARQLAELTGAYVHLDRKRLDDAGIGTDTPLPGDQWRVKSPAPARNADADPFGPPAQARRDPSSGSVADPPEMVRQTPWGAAGKISLRSGARHLLRQLGLALVEEPNRLVITPTDGAESRLTLEVYPVADLMFTDQTTPPWLLVNPYLDQQERVRRASGVEAPTEGHDRVPRTAFGGSRGGPGGEDRRDGPDRY